MAADDLHPGVNISRSGNVFGLTLDGELWRAVCLRCDTVVAESCDLAEINAAEARHHCGRNPTQSNQ